MARLRLDTLSSLTIFCNGLIPDWISPQGKVCLQKGGESNFGEWKHIDKAKIGQIGVK